MSAAPLLMFGEDWHGLPSSTQHLARQLVGSRHITWVNSIGLRRPKLSLRDVSRAANKVKCMLSRGKPSAKAPDRRMPIDLVDPRAVSWPGSPVAGKVNRLLLGHQLRSHLDRLGIERPILWSSLPTAVDVIGTLGERAVVYYCCDDFSGLAGVDHGPVSQMEAELADAADLIIAVNDQLAAKFDPEKTIVIPHGVDLDLFTRDVPRASDLPDGKVAGFYGSLADWIDVDLIAETARIRPDWHFFLIGPCQTDVSALSACRNVTLAGPRAHHELPSYSRHWQVSLLPFRNSLQIRNCNPLKLREYLAAGPPVISTPCPAVEAYGQAIIVHNPEGLSRALDASHGDALAEERRAAVTMESWQARATIIDLLLDKL